MSAWRALLRLVSGWALMLGGVIVMLDNSLPRSANSSRMRLGMQALAGFALVAGGWWLRRRALRPPENRQ